MGTREVFVAGEGSKQSEVIRQIAQAWESAQAQLRELRQSVQRTAELAQAQTESVALVRERDRALRDLGEAVWNQVKKGQLQVPPAVEPALRLLEVVERKAQARAASITALLQESEVVAPAAKGAPRKTPTKETKVLAARPKKR